MEEEEIKPLLQSAASEKSFLKSTQEVTSFGDPAWIFYDDDTTSSSDVDAIASEGGLSPLALRQAISMLKNAFRGRKPTERIDPATIELSRKVHSKAVQILTFFVVFVHLGLAVLEPPRDLAPRWFLTLVELLILYFYMLEVLVYHRLLLPGQLAREGRVLCLCALVLITFGDICGNLFTGSVRWTLCLRPGFVLCHSRTLRKMAWYMMLVFVHAFQLLLVIGSVVLTFATLNYVLFKNTEDSMSTLKDAIINTYVLSTTANFPTIMMPAFHKDYWSSVVFVVFIVLTTFVLYNLLSAVIFSSYQSISKVGFKRRLREEMKTLAMVFVLLDSSQRGCISLRTWRKLFKSWKPNYDTYKVALLFKVLDTEDNNELSPQQFCKILDVRSVHIRSNYEIFNTFWKRNFPKFNESKFMIWVRKLVYSRKSVLIMDGFVIFTITYTMILLAGHVSRRRLVSFGTVTFIVFLVEAVLKVLASGPQLYWKKWTNRFDLILLCANLADIIYGSTIGPDASNTIIRTLSFFRILRIHRLTIRFASLRAIALAVAEMIPTILAIFVLELLFFYSFTQVGMFLWAGKIAKSNPALDNTEYARLDYFPISFNNFDEGILFCFQLFVVSNWQIMAGAYEAVATTAVWYFFITFHVLAVLIGANVLLSAIVSTFWLHKNQLLQLHPIQAAVDKLGKIAYLQPKLKPTLDTRFTWSIRTKPGFHNSQRFAIGNKVRRMIEEKEGESFEDMIVAAREKVSKMTETDYPKTIWRVNMNGVRDGIWDNWAKLLTHLQDVYDTFSIANYLYFDDEEFNTDVSLNFTSRESVLSPPSYDTIS